MSKVAAGAAVGIAVAAALGAVVATFLVGGRLAEPTVVADPHQAGLRTGAGRMAAARDEEKTGPARCAISAGPCEARMAEAGATVTLEIEPRPVRALADLTFTVRARRGALPLGGADGEIALSMPGMYMGENRVRLASLGGGVYRGKGVIVRCPSGHRSWSAEVILRPREPATAAPLRAAFALELAE